MNTFTRTFRNILFLVQAKHYRGHGVHSPFLYHLIREVFEDKKTKPYYQALTKHWDAYTSHIPRHHAFLLYRMFRRFLVGRVDTSIDVISKASELLVCEEGQASALYLELPTQQIFAAKPDYCLIVARKSTAKANGHFVQKLTELPSSYQVIETAQMFYVMLNNQVPHYHLKYFFF